jgi:hypothetical protein
MKTFRTILTTILIVFPLFILTAQTPPHPNGGGGPGGGNTPVGGGAPLDGGLLIMLSLAAGYGTKKVYNRKGKALMD